MVKILIRLGQWPSKLLSDSHLIAGITVKLTLELDHSGLWCSQRTNRDTTSTQKSFRSNLVLPYCCNQPCAPSDRSPCCNAPHVLPGDPSNTLRSCLEFASTTGLQITLNVFSNVLYKSTSILMYMSLSTSIQLTKGWFGWRDSFFIENGWQSNHCGLCDYILDFLKWFRVECLIALVVQNLTTFITWGKIFTFMAKKI